MKNTFITISKIVLIMAIPLVLILLFQGFNGGIYRDMTSLVGTVPLLIINHIVYLIHTHSGKPKSIKNLSLTLFALTLVVCVCSILYHNAYEIFVNMFCNIVLLFYYVPFVFLENKNEKE